MENVVFALNIIGEAFILLALLAYLGGRREHKQGKAEHGEKLGAGQKTFRVFNTKFESVTGDVAAHLRRSHEDITHLAAAVRLAEQQRANPEPSRRGRPPSGPKKKGKTHPARRPHPSGRRPPSGPRRRPPPGRPGSESGRVRQGSGRRKKSGDTTADIAAGSVLAHVSNDEQRAKEIDDLLGDLDGLRELAKQGESELVSASQVDSRAVSLFHRSSVLLFLSLVSLGAARVLPPLFGAIRAML